MTFRQGVFFMATSGVRCRLLMPLVRPLHQFVLFVTIPLLHLADELVAIAFDLLQRSIGELAILLFEFTFELHPLSFELICVHALLPFQVKLCSPGCRLHPALSAYILPLTTSMPRRPKAV